MRGRDTRCGINAVMRSGRGVWDVGVRNTTVAKHCRELGHWVHHRGGREGVEFEGQMDGGLSGLPVLAEPSETLLKALPCGSVGGLDVPDATRLELGEPQLFGDFVGLH